MPYRAIIPNIFGKDWWDMWDYPNFITDQCFAIHICDEDLLTPIQHCSGLSFRPRCLANFAASGKSEVIDNENQFQVVLDVSQFKPEEVQLKVEGNYIVIHGKHEEKADEHGLVSREFTRRYMLPKSCEMDAVSSSMNLKGMLTVTAPKKAIEEPSKRERAIPIVMESKEAVKDCK